MPPEFGHGRLQHGRSLPPEFGEHALREGQPEQVAGRLLDRPLAQAVTARQQAEHGVQPGAECPGGDARR